MSEWQPIETAPRDGAEIDLSVLSKDGVRFRAPGVVWKSGVWRNVAERWVLWDDVIPTHWMPLPEPPK